MASEQKDAGGTSIFAQPVESVGMFENVGKQATDEPRPAPAPAAESNPFDTGIDEVSAPQPESSEPEEDRDAVIRVQFDTGQMEATVYVEPPSGAGAPVGKESLDAAIAQAGIVYGLLPEGIETVLAPTYRQDVTIARGTPPVDGTDGVCTELYERERTPQRIEREDGSVDYKELGLIVDLKAGTTICEVTQPTEGSVGTNVLGKALKPRAGQKPVLPVGEGTQLSADGKRIETTVQGNLVFRNNRFTVDKVYRVEDVDYDVGNITFSGDVVVNGEMKDGFEIHCGANVTLRGQVGAVVVQADGDVTIEKGINGMGRATVECKGDLKAGFIENSILHVGKNISAKSIINSQVECEGDIEVTSGRGLICGGKVTAFGSIKANEVGNDSNTLTIVTLGVTPSLLKERKRLGDQLADVKRNIDEMEKNIAYIERLVADGRPVPPDRVSILQRTKIAMPMSEKKRDQLDGQIKDLESKMSEVNNATLSARVLHPPTRISIGSVSTNCVETRNMAKVFKDSGGDIVFGSM